MLDKQLAELTKEQLLVIRSLIDDKISSFEEEEKSFVLTPPKRRLIVSFNDFRSFLKESNKGFGDFEYWIGKDEENILTTHNYGGIINGKIFVEVGSFQDCQSADVVNKNDTFFVRDKRENVFYLLEFPVVVSLPTSTIYPRKNLTNISDTVLNKNHASLFREVFSLKSFLEYYSFNDAIEFLRGFTFYDRYYGFTRQIVELLSYDIGEEKVIATCRTVGEEGTRQFSIHLKGCRDLLVYPSEKQCVTTYDLKLS